MLPLLGEDAERAAEQATAILEGFPALFAGHWVTGMRGKLGLFGEEAEDAALADGLLEWMHQRSADYTNTFVALTAGRPLGDAATADGEAAAWHSRWTARRARQPQSHDEAVALMRRHNPAVIPRNHLVEAALTAASDAGDLGPIERLLAALATPYDHDRDPGVYGAPDPDARPYRTFCGT
jgi:uncharacterized protein YdiU (UPF0061 family)